MKFIFIFLVIVIALIVFDTVRTTEIKDGDSEEEIAEKKRKRSRGAQNVKALMWIVGLGAFMYFVFFVFWPWMYGQL